jgi:hypothetical protein
MRGVLRCLPDCIPGLLDGPDSRGLRQVRDAWHSSDAVPLLDVVCGVLGVIVLVVVVLAVADWWTSRHGPALMSFVVVLLAVVLAVVSIATMVVGSFWGGLGGLALSVFVIVVGVCVDERTWSGDCRG